MLKIKENVDLKELEKFGFVEFENDFELIYLIDDEYEYCMFVFKSNREICCSFGVPFLLDGLFELIQAGLVEKVEK